MMNDHFAMSSLLNSSINGPSSNFTDSTGRSFPSPYSVQSGGVSPGFHHNGTYQGMQNMHGSFNVPSMGGALPARNSTMNVAPSVGMQQSTGNHLAGRFGSNNLPAALSQISHGSSPGHSGVTNRGSMNSIGNPGYNSSTNSVGGSVPGVLQTSAAIGNRGTVPGFGASSFLGNAGSQNTSSMGNVVGSGSGYVGRSPGGALSMPGLGSRLEMSNSGSGNIGLQPNRLMIGGLQQQASQNVMNMLANPYAPGGGPLSQSHAQSGNNLNSMALLNDVNSNDKSPFGVDDFPTLSSRPNSAGGSHGQIGSMRKQGIGGPTNQQNHEFSIQNEDFPALPGAKGGNVDYSTDFLQKDQLRDGSVSMMQNQHFSMGRSAGFTGGAYPSSRPQQHQQSMPSVSGVSDSFVPLNHQGRSHLQGSDMFQSSNSMYPIQHNGHLDNGVRSMNNLAAMSSYDQQMQHYQQQKPSSFHLRQMSAVDPLFRDQGVNSIQAAHAIDQSFRDQGINSIHAAHAIDKPFRDQGVNSIQAAHAIDQSFRDKGVNSIQATHAIDPSYHHDQGVNSIQATHAAPDPYGLLGLLSIIGKNNPDLAPLALGIDLTSLGLNLSSSEDLHKTFNSPWSDSCVKENPAFVLPQCYNEKPPPDLNQRYFMKFRLETLFYIFYSMPKDEAQLYAANELYRRGWFYHKELQTWFSRFLNEEPLVKTSTYERGSYIMFDPHTWERKAKENFVLQYDLVEKRPILHQR